MKERTPLLQRGPKPNTAPVHTWSDQAIDADTLLASDDIGLIQEQILLRQKLAMEQSDRERWWACRVEINNVWSRIDELEETVQEVMAS